MISHDSGRPEGDVRVPPSAATGLAAEDLEVLRSLAKEDPAEGRYQAIVPNSREEFWAIEKIGPLFRLTLERPAYEPLDIPCMGDVPPDGSRQRGEVFGDLNTGEIYRSSFSSGPSMSITFPTAEELVKDFVCCSRNDSLRKLGTFEHLDFMSPFAKG